MANLPRTFRAFLSEFGSSTRANAHSSRGWAATAIRDTAFCRTNEDGADAGRGKVGTLAGVGGMTKQSVLAQSKLEVIGEKTKYANEDRTHSASHDFSWNVNPECNSAKNS